MTTQAGYIGSDAVKNRFTDPKTNEAYFVLVNETTGEMELYNEEFLADKRVGTISTDGTIEYNENWWGGANANDKAFADAALQDGTIKRQAYNLLQREGDLSPAQSKALLNSNVDTRPFKASESDIKAATKALQSSNESTNASGSKVSGFPHLVFPEKIRDTNQDIIKFNMMKYRPKEFNKETFGFEERGAGNIIGSVILPIPAGIADQNSVTWGSDNMNAVKAAMAQAALEGITSKNPVEGVLDSFKQSADKVAGNNAEVRGALATYLAGQASGNQNLMTRTTGAILNPNMELLFQAPTLRPFSFSFNLSARNKKEGEEIVRIIRFFKQGMAPIRSKANLFLKSPHTFQINYKYRGTGNQDHKFLNKFKECALQGFGVQYTPTGNYSTFSDGIMTQYQVTMTFTELEPIFNDNYGTANLDEIGY